MDCCFSESWQLSRHERCPCSVCYEHFWQFLDLDQKTVYIIADFSSIMYYGEDTLNFEWLLVAGCVLKLLRHLLQEASICSFREVAFFIQNAQHTQWLLLNQFHQVKIILKINLLPFNFFSEIITFP